MSKQGLGIMVCGTALWVAVAMPAGATGSVGLFDVEARRQALQTAAFSGIRQFCLEVPTDPAWRYLRPIARLVTTDGYGSDQSAEDFSWAVMVLGGRILAGDAIAEAMLLDLMSRWADADAFGQTEEVNDAYYALKRQLLPLTVSYAILKPHISEDQANNIAAWIDPLVRKIDKIFDGDVDHNNHRDLADSVLAVWGAIIDDDALMRKGLARYHTVLASARADGTLELEARRGARALWYQRQTLSSLTVLAEVARMHGMDFYGDSGPAGQRYATLLGALLNGIAEPVLVAVYASENHIPGPEKSFLTIDLGFLETRGHGRHYMAWSEAAVHAGTELVFQRLKGLFARDLGGQRPLIDEFAGGNATCFWGEP